MLAFAHLGCCYVFIFWFSVVARTGFFTHVASMSYLLLHVFPLCLLHGDVTALGVSYCTQISRRKLLEE